MNFSILKSWQVVLLLVFLAVSIAMIAPWGSTGIYVKYVDQDSPFFGTLEPGDAIYRINGKEADSASIRNLSGYTILDTSRGSIKKTINESGIIAEKRISNIRFGLDVEGGILAVVSPVDNVSDEVMYDIRSILEKRMSSLRESSFQIVKYEDRRFIQIQIAGGTESDLKKIINTTGIFEAKVPLPVDLKNGSGLLRYGPSDEWLTVKPAGNGSIEVMGRVLQENQIFIYKNVTFEIWNISGSRADIAAVVYRNDGTRKDVVKVYIDPQHSFVQSSGYDYYNWRFDVDVSQEASQVFYNSIRNLNIKYAGTEPYLESKIYLYLDGSEVNNLSIGATLKNKPVITATVSGSSPTKEKALEEKRLLQTVLQSGALPSELKIESIQTISPKLGQNFLNYIALAFFVAVIVVSIIIFIRYRHIEISFLVVATCLSEIIIILGSSVVIGWTLDMAAIAGIMAVIGTGVDQQVMIVDEILIGEKSASLKAKIKRAFFLIFGTAGTVLAAMFPLMILGFGMLRGFALTTSLGVLIAIFITRPAFTIIVEKIMKE